MDSVWSSSIHFLNLILLTPPTSQLPHLHLEQINLGPSTSSNLLCTLSPEVCAYVFLLTGKFFSPFYQSNCYFFLGSQDWHLWLKFSGSPVYVTSHWCRLSENRISLLWITHAVRNYRFIDTIICLTSVLFFLANFIRMCSLAWHFNLFLPLPCIVPSASLLVVGISHLFGGFSKKKYTFVHFSYVWGIHFMSPPVLWQNPETYFPSHHTSKRVASMWPGLSQLDVKPLCKLALWAGQVTRQVLCRSHSAERVAMAASLPEAQSRRFQELSLVSGVISASCGVVPHCSTSADTVMCRILEICSWKNGLQDGFWGFPRDSDTYICFLVSTCYNSFFCLPLKFSE